MPSSQSSSSTITTAENKRDEIIERRIITAIVIALRVIIGATFIVSGWAKAIDPWGTIYKISEYFDVWGIDIPPTLVTFFSFALSAWEFVWGALLLLGTYRRVSVIALLLTMAGMLPLSLYIAIASPVADCGCFGDLLTISNTGTFIKNIFITAALIYLLAVNTRVGQVYTTHTQWIVGGVLTFFILIIALIGYNIQPLVDFRRFSPGTSLMNTAEDEDSDEEEVTYEFIYTRDGVAQSFTADELPDSTWTFVDRHLTAGSETIDDGLTVMVDGTDIMPEIIAPDGDGPLPEQFIVTIPDPDKVDISFTNIINDLNDYITERGGTLTTFIAGTDEAIERWDDIAMASYPTYRVEPNLIKELARGSAALVYLTEGKVQWKRTLSSIDTEQLGRHTASHLEESLDPHLGSLLKYMNYALATCLILLLIFDLFLPRHNKSESAAPSTESPDQPSAISTDNK